MTLCFGPECMREAYSKGMCLAHYKQHRKGNALQVLRQEVVFTGFEKPKDNRGCWWSGCVLKSTGRGLCSKHHTYLNKRGGPFPKEPRKFHRISSIDVKTMTAECESCGPTEIKRHVKRDKEWVCIRTRTRSIEDSWKRRLTRYGLSKNEYDILMLRQNFKCPICKLPLNDDNWRSTAVDHCHSTGKVRGILHAKCNIGLGHFEDNVDRLQAAIGYLNAASN